MHKLISVFCFFQTVIFGYDTVSTLDRLIKESIDPNTLIVIDLDHILIRPAQQLGCEEWVNYEMGKLLKEGMNKKRAATLVENKWAKVQRKSKIMPLEKQTEEVLKELQKQHLSVVFMTERSPKFAKLTLKQLKELHITSPPFEQNFQLENGVVFEQGILFLGRHENREKSLLSFLQTVKPSPKHLVIIDSELERIKIFEKVLVDNAMSHQVYHFKSTCESFDPAITDVQWEYFQSILSDEKAKALVPLNM